ncbi:hypothetical protein SAMN04489725_1163 [Alicyclobacillus hesperidum]|uniref:Uncharacterized protein n=1 Tax=Alicyclobacillus hesperidum TaxID=89784 RepID=A0A1H2WMT1_9BACL|nr:hypothetical protein [Alicyclobacillus hesperidum]SDW81932.1 hypothetical protein SAMN04489725_1163 [Alicyclobacillus hesperidum]
MYKSFSAILKETEEVYQRLERYEQVMRRLKMRLESSVRDFKPGGVKDFDLCIADALEAVLEALDDGLHYPDDYTDRFIKLKIYQLRNQQNAFGERYHGVVLGLGNN